MDSVFLIYHMDSDSIPGVRKIFHGLDFISIQKTYINDLKRCYFEMIIEEVRNDSKTRITLLFASL